MDSTSYNTTGIERFFNETATPQELRHDLISLAFTLSREVTPDTLESFRQNMSAIECVIELLDTAEKAG